MPRHSLFVVSLPRSLSTLLYHAVRRALALDEPRWTTDGEILNVRRFALLPEEGDVEGVRYVEPQSTPHDLAAAADPSAGAGLPGLAGPSGLPGASDLPGRPGVPGLARPSDLAGPSSFPVASSLPGAASFPGASEPSGLPGPLGPLGPPGRPDPSGAPGAPGSAGRPGRPDGDSALCDKLIAFLDQVVQAEGFAYKDVIQPFVVAQWLTRRAAPAARGCAPRVLFLDRPVADVAVSLLERGWLYPALAATGSAALPPAARAAAAAAHSADLSAHATPDRVERALVAGLLRARGALAAAAAQCGGPRLPYDKVIESEAPLHQALRSLYGGDIAPPAYLDDDFRRRRDALLERRRGALCCRLNALCAELDGAAASGGAAAGRD